MPLLEATRPDLSEAALVGITGTQYNKPGDPRLELSLQTAHNWQEAGLPYVVTDSSDEQNHPAVAQSHRALGAIVRPAEIGGIATQRIEGVAYAVEHGANKVLSAEPEKDELVEHAEEISAALDDFDVLVIGRTQSAEDTLPPVQQRTERLAGWILKRVLDLPADALSGGRGFTRAGAEVLAEYQATKIDPETQNEVSDPSRNNWLYLYETPLTARERGLRVGGIALDFKHPDAMVAEETNNPIFDKKRYDQFELQINYLLGRHVETMEDGADRKMVEWILEMSGLIRDASSGSKDIDVIAAENVKRAELIGLMESALADEEGYVPAERLLRMGISRSGTKKIAEALSPAGATSPAAVATEA